MLFIFSEDTDVFTDKVCAELNDTSIKFIRFDDKIGVSDFAYENTSKGSSIRFNDYQPTIIWQRRDRFNIISNISHDYLKKEADSVIKSTEIYLKKMLST